MGKIPGTLIKELRLKDGRVFPKGEKLQIIPPLQMSPWTCQVVLDIDDIISIKTSRLGYYFKEFELITMNDLERGAFDSVCLSMTGEEVEPDGWDEHGFPSMLLAMGMI